MLRVLVIEDDRGVASALAQVLAFGACEVEVQFDGLTGLRRLRTPPPDLVLLDLALPGMGGREVLAHVAADPRLRRIPVVVVTAARPAELLPPSSQYRALLNKPFDVDEVLQLVAAFDPQGTATARWGASGCRPSAQAGQGGAGL